MEYLYLALLHYIWFTHKKLFKIFENKQNYKEVFENINYDFLKNLSFQEKQINFILKKYSLLKLENLAKKLKQRKVEIITYFDSKYPKNLKNIFNPPFLLYVRGEIDNLPKFAIIWSRKISSYWKKVIEDFVPDLAKYFSIVSWGAAWCDTYAHKEALKNNWKTIAVIWTWIDLDYPMENKKFFDEIAELGAVISIFPIWEVGNSYNFPVRNEIVAWLAKGILVVEAREKSGSLITANLGLELWKDIFAVPGDIYKWWAVWTNNLIKQWNAKLTTKISDILEEYNIQNKKNKSKQNIKFNDEIEQKIYNTLILDNLKIDELSKKINLDISTISFKLSMMEITGLIKKNNMWYYEII